MILSFHPCFDGDRFINCGGRNLTPDDIAAIKQASAVILPQACKQSLYEAARKHCNRIFPDFNTKFAYPDKTGQTELFRETSTPHPKTCLFSNVADFQKKTAGSDEAIGIEFPMVLKLNGADEGYGVFLAESADEIPPLIDLAARTEKSGNPGFLVQQYIETSGRVLRVCVIYKTIKAYWRVSQDPADFRVNFARGAAIDNTSLPELQEKGVEAVKQFCDKTGINLAGFDLIFSSTDQNSQPLFLEINYYFGRRGLGGTEKYYQILIQEIEKWLTDQKEAVATHAL